MNGVGTYCTENSKMVQYTRSRSSTVHDRMCIEMILDNRILHEFFYHQKCTSLITLNSEQAAAVTTPHHFRVRIDRFYHSRAAIRYPGEPTENPSGPSSTSSRCSFSRAGLLKSVLYCTVSSYSNRISHSALTI